MDSPWVVTFTLEPNQIIPERWSIDLLDQTDELSVIKPQEQRQLNAIKVKRALADIRGFPVN
jgi:hypothetical protein